MASVVNELIEKHVSKYLTEIFSTAGQNQPLAAVVVFDDIAKLFRFGGYTPEFKTMLSSGPFKSIGTGMEIDPGGLLSYAIKRFQHVGTEIWAYGLSLADDTILEGNLTPGVIHRDQWMPIPPDRSRAGSQLVNFRTSLATYLGQRSNMEHLILLPFSALSSSKGLVLIVWVERDLSIPSLANVLTFLQTQGPLLSSYQILLTGEAERGNTAGFRRLARIIEHEENGYLRTFETLIRRLEALEKENKLSELDIKKKYIEFLKDRLRSKKQLSLEMSDFDSLNRVPINLLYNEEINLSSTVKKIVEEADKALRTSKLKAIEVEFGEGVKNDSTINLNHYILDRIIRNAVKNSTRRCERGKQATTKIFIDVYTDTNGRYLHLTIEDDAGGLSDVNRIIPRDLTPQIWSYFCAERPDIIRPDKGVGLWAISRYSYSLGGRFLLEDVLASDGGVIGLRYNILLRLDMSNHQSRVSA